MCKNQDRVWTYLLMSFWAMAISAWWWPASWWFEVNNLYVHNAKAGEVVTMTVDREIKRTFHADWGVTIRKIEPRGSLIVCNAWGTTSYRVDAVLPEQVTLGWWTGNVCNTLEPGNYILSTVWDISENPLPSKQVAIESNMFTITE